MQSQQVENNSQSQVSSDKQIKERLIQLSKMEGWIDFNNLLDREIESEKDKLLNCQNVDQMKESQMTVQAITRIKSLVPKIITGKPNKNIGGKYSLPDLRY